MNKTNKKIWELLKYLDNHCYICKKSIILLCGHPEIRIGGCCVGYKFKEKIWLTSRYAHLYPCYEKANSKHKTMETEYQTKKMLKKIIINKIKIETDTLNKEPLCKGKWREEIKQELSKLKGQLKIGDFS